MMEMTCALPFSDTDCILLEHGSGGRLSHRLISELFYPAFNNPLLQQQHDGCVFPVEAGRMACTTDSFVVQPVFFPGGNIGDLAINGTVNDLACCGAVPMYLTAGFILEEGLPLADLQRIVETMSRAAAKASVRIVAGDTKVVERGKCDRIFINTCGIGTVPPNIDISPLRAAAGDVIICSGNIGVHGVAILSARESLGFETVLQSDTASLNQMLAALLARHEVHVMRDPTRGGVGTTLNEIAQSAKVAMVIDDAALPIPETVRAASELLGIDPLFIANEGTVLVILPEKAAVEALSVLRQFPEGKNAAVIGRVTASDKASVHLKTGYGSHRIITMLNGDQLPRIC